LFNQWLNSTFLLNIWRNEMRVLTSNEITTIAGGEVCASKGDVYTVTMLKDMQTWAMHDGIREGITAGGVAAMLGGICLGPLGAIVAAVAAAPYGYHHGFNNSDAFPWNPRSNNRFV